MCHLLASFAALKCLHSSSLASKWLFNFEVIFVPRYSAAFCSLFFDRWSVELIEYRLCSLAAENFLILVWILVRNFLVEMCKSKRGKIFFPNHQHNSGHQPEINAKFIAYKEGI